MWENDPRVQFRKAVFEPLTEYSQGEMHGHVSWFWSLRKREIRTKDTNIRATDTEVIAEMIMGGTEYGAWSYRR